MVENFDDLTRRVLKRAEAGNSARITNARHVRQRLRAPSGCHPKARRLPALTYAMDEGNELKKICTCPPSRSTSACAPPR